MAQISMETRHICFSASNPLPFLIPFLLTILLIIKNRITFNNKWLKIVLFSFICWFVAYSFKIHRFGGEYWFLGVFNLAFIILYSYIHAAVFGKDLLLIFEKIMVCFSVIALFFYVFQLLSPYAARSFFSMFPDTEEGGNNFLYLYKYFYETSDRDFYTGLTRNSGCSWEPGRFSIMLIYAIFVNILRNGKITFNKSFIILNIALITTFSTTGIIILFVEYLLFSVKKVSFTNMMLFCLIFIPLGYFIFNLDFVSSKITSQLDAFVNLDTFIRYQGNRDDSEAILALERIPSIGVEFRNWLEDPLVGYGHWGNSWFYNSVTESATTCGSLMQVFSTYGIFLGIFFYTCLFVSSQNISRLFGDFRGGILFIITLLSSVSYPVFGVMFFTSFWFFGLFVNNEVK